MVKVNLSGCASFVADAEYKAYVEKSLQALEVLDLIEYVLEDGNKR